MRPVHHQFLRFVFTGLTSTLLDLLALQLLLSARMASIFAVALAFLAGVGVNLLMHKFYTFRDSSRLSRHQVARYLAVVVFNLMLTEFVVWGAGSLLDLAPLQGKLLSLPLVLAVGFSLSRRWVFVPQRGVC